MHQKALAVKFGKLKETSICCASMGKIRTFNETLWYGSVEQVRILKDGTVRFIFKDGAVVVG